MSPSCNIPAAGGSFQERPIPSTSTNTNIMFKNYWKIALRQLRNQKFYSAIKIGGFALGIATCLLMTLYIREESSFDQFYPNTGQIYRVYGHWRYRGKDDK